MRLRCVAFVALLLLLSGCTGYGQLPPGETPRQATEATKDPDASPGPQDENRSQDYSWSSTLRNSCGVSCSVPSEQTTYEPLGTLTMIDLVLQWSSPVPGLDPQLVFDAKLQNATVTQDLRSVQGTSPLRLRMGLDPDQSANQTLVLRVRFASGGTPTDQPFSVSGTLWMLVPRDA